MTQPKHTLPPLLQQALHAELKPHERVVWADQPIACRLMLPVFGIWIFAIPWTAFSFFWESIALGMLFAQGEAPDAVTQGFAWIFPLFGLPFCLIGIGMMLAPYFVWRQAKRTLYAITNQRTIILKTKRSGAEIESYKPLQLNYLRKSVAKDGSGKILFRKETEIDGDGDRRTKETGFEAIREVRKVEALIEKLKASSDNTAESELDTMMQNYLKDAGGA